MELFSNLHSSFPSLYHKASYYATPFFSRSSHLNTLSTNIVQSSLPLNTIDESFGYECPLLKVFCHYPHSSEWYFFVYPLFVINLKLSPFSLSSLSQAQLFQKCKWEDDWIEAARQLVEDEFDLSYNPSYPLLLC